MPVKFWIAMQWLRSHMDDERGATLIEYALLVSLVALMCAGAMKYLGVVAGSKLSTVAGSIGQPM